MERKVGVVKPGRWKGLSHGGSMERGLGGIISVLSIHPEQSSLLYDPRLNSCRPPNRKIADPMRADPNTSACRREIPDLKQESPGAAPPCLPERDAHHG